MTRPIDYSMSKICEQCGSIFYRDKRNTKKYWATAKFCSRQCSSQSWSASRRNDEITRERFFSNVQKQSTGCWSWSGSVKDDGRGVLCVSGRQTYASHVSLALHGRPLPKGKIACHTCDNKNCVNPSHLYAGTPAQNSRDAVLRGQIHWRKLTKSSVLEIRSSGLSINDLSEKHGVTPAAIRKVINRTTWKHV